MTPQSPSAERTFWPPLGPAPCTEGRSLWQRARADGVCPRPLQQSLGNPPQAESADPRV